MKVIVYNLARNFDLELEKLRIYCHRQGLKITSEVVDRNEHRQIQLKKQISIYFVDEKLEFEAHIQKA